MYNAPYQNLYIVEVREDGGDHAVSWNCITSFRLCSAPGDSYPPRSMLGPDLTSAPSVYQAGLFFSDRHTTHDRQGSSILHPNPASPKLDLDPIQSRAGALRSAYLVISACPCPKAMQGPM